MPLENGGITVIDLIKDENILDKIGISKREYFDILKDYLIEINGEYFFQKEVSYVDVVNEIIGRYLCHKINLRTTSLKVVRKSLITYKIITPNYRSNKYIYFKPEDNFEYGEYVENFNDRYFKNLEDVHKKDLYKLLAVDLMMEQEDRYARNMEEYYPNNTIRLAPITDFSNTFINYKNFTYFNPYILIRKDLRSLDLFYNRYPEGYKFFKDIFETDYEEIEEYLKTRYSLVPRNSVKKNVINTMKRNKELIKSLH